MTNDRKKELLEYAFNDVVKFLLTAFIGVISYVFVNLDADIKKIHTQISELSSKVESATIRTNNIEKETSKHEEWIKNKDREDLMFYRNKRDK